MATPPRRKPRLYLDTSIPSAYWDDREPARMARTREFWQQVPAYDVYVSAMTIDEVSRHPDKVRRTDLLDLLRPFTVLPVTAEAEA
ncbi:MAG: PIN domain-containing protein, partial [Candidatus Methylomirabilales bacterium]